MTRVRVQVMPKGTVLDPQGATVERSLSSLGHDAVGVRVGRVVELTIPDSTPAEAMAKAEAMCEQLLGNPVIESWTVEVLAVDAAAELVH